MIKNSAIYHIDNTVSAPSNIALIKYMGLLDSEKKIPSNPSLSYTLMDIRTSIEIKKSDTDFIEAPVGQERYFRFYLFLKDKFSIKDKYHLKSSNNFPDSCGLASSASSFAALTAAVAVLSGIEDFSNIAHISRFGSGSSCRSFYKNFVTWSEDGVFAEELPEMDLKHAVILVDKKRKKISSSMAHKIVTSSNHFKSRQTSVRERFHVLKELIKNNSWDDAAIIIREEYLEMHNLFETSVPSFSYRTEKCKKIEQWLLNYTNIYGFSPWVTLDAGPNIHLLFPDKSIRSHCLNELSRSLNEVEVIYD